MTSSESSNLSTATSAGARDTDRPESARLRILCLHGYHGSGRVLRGQMAALAAAIDPVAELVFLDAPSLASGDYGWWHAVERDPDPASDDPGVGGPRGHYKGWERTRAAIVAAFAAQGPFDGVLGFSQGAALTGLLVGFRAPDRVATPERPLVFDFAILVSGFASNDPELARLYARRDAYALPSLHIVGRADGIVPPEDTRALAARFASPVVLEHPGGHVVASDAAIAGGVLAFLEERRPARPKRTASEARPRGAIEVPLWSGASSARMRVSYPSVAGPTPALVVFRGGAYATSQGSGEGADRWAADNGMVGVEVPYRTQASGDAFPKGYADAARATRIVRARAAEWGIDPKRVGVLGFSAGGHLASLLSTQPTLHRDAADDLASIDARPDFVILAYPLVSFVDGYAVGAFAGSAENFLGRRDLDEETRRRFSNELHVTAQHPPVFVWTTAEDAIVPASHSRRFAEACERAGVPVTLKVFPHGPHGMGLALGRDVEASSWTEEARAWLVTRGVLAR